jgi:zinc protease
VTITIETGHEFSLERMLGDKFKEEHVLDLPFNYFFPKRLNNPRLAEGQSWEAAVDENFLLIYNPNFEPGKKYTVTLEIDK